MSHSVAILDSVSVSTIFLIFQGCQSIDWQIDYYGMNFSLAEQRIVLALMGKDL